ncbi:MAG: SidE phosphodiesterase domain-containing protein [Coxiellaceae bacterium]|nr:SidE phosphodiesterase domain-containing protein [Coxiellaceae bacterium]
MLPPLLQGPAKKNLALRHVEYVFHCLLGIDFVSYPDETDIYAAKNDGAGRPFEFRLEKDENNSVIAYGKNGQRYNLSLALEHANLGYFQLTESEHDRSIIKRCEVLLGTTAEGSIANILTSDIGKSADKNATGIPCYVAEQAAIKIYTGNRYEKINELLRGKPPRHESIGDTTKTIIQSLLAISGTNKNINAKAFKQKSHLFRSEGTLPDDMFMRMKTAGQIVRRSGLLSFTTKANLRNKKNMLRLRSQTQWQGSVAHISLHENESETLFPPSYVRFTGFNPNGSDSNLFSAQIIRGVCVDWQDNYLTTLAMQDAHRILKKPYKNSINPRFGIARHNHALAHHIRASFLIEPTMEYFKQHAADENLRKFCDTLQPSEIIIKQAHCLLNLQYNNKIVYVNLNQLRCPA